MNLTNVESYRQKVVLGAVILGAVLLDLLKQARQNDAAPHLVINRVGVPKRPEIKVDEFAQRA